MQVGDHKAAHDESQPSISVREAPEKTVRVDPSGETVVASIARPANRLREIRPGFSPQPARVVPAMPMFFAFSLAGALLPQGLLQVGCKG